MSDEISLAVGGGTELAVVEVATLSTRVIGVHEERWDDDRIVREFLEVKGRNSDNTRLAYQQDIDFFRAFLFSHFEGVGLAPGDIEIVTAYETWLREAVSSKDKKVKMAKSTANRRMSGLSSFYAWASRAKNRSKTGIILNPVDFERYKIQSDFNERVLEEAEVLRLIDAAAAASGRDVFPSRDAALIQFLYHSAGRVSEVVNLQWKHITRNSTGGGVIHFFGKGGKERWVIISEGMWQKLNTYPCDRSPDSYLFQNQKGGRLNRSTVYGIIKRCAAAIGIYDTTPHVLRHTHATHAIRRGVSPDLLKQTLGHSSLAVTSNYLKANPTDSSALHLIV